MSLWVPCQSKGLRRSGDAWTVSSTVRPFRRHSVPAGGAGRALRQGLPRARWPCSATFMLPGSELPLVPVLRRRPACLSLIIEALHEDPSPPSQPPRPQALSLVLCPAAPRPTHSPNARHPFLL